MYVITELINKKKILFKFDISATTVVLNVPPYCILWRVQVRR